MSKNSLKEVLVDYTLHNEVTRHFPEFPWRLIARGETNAIYGLKTFRYWKRKNSSEGNFSQANNEKTKPRLIMREMLHVMKVKKINFQRWDAF